MKMYNTPLGKIMLYLAHDHTSASLIAICRINNILKNPDIPKEELIEQLEKIKEKIKKCDEVVNYTYKQVKELYENDKLTF